MGSGKNRKYRRRLGTRVSRRAATKLYGPIMAPGSIKNPDPRKKQLSVRARVSQILRAEGLTK